MLLRGQEKRCWQVGNPSAISSYGSHAPMLSGFPIQPQSLSQWRSVWIDLYKPQLECFYLFSEDYDQLWHSIWVEYDRLKAAHFAVSRSGFSWQKQIERHRYKINRSRKEVYQPVKSEHWAYLPLSVQLDRYCNTWSQDRRHHWKATFENFLNFQRHYNANTETSRDSQNGSQCSSFRESLPQTQCASYETLKQWWAAAYCHQELLAAVRSFLNPVEPLTNELYGPESANIEELLLLDQSYYHRICFHLFIREFNPRMWEPFIGWISLTQLNKARSFASWVATAQCLSYNMLSPPEPGHERSYPSIVPFTDLRAAHQGSEGNPRWLWDIQAQKTVAVADFESVPAYVCISHTWGRWRKPTSANVNGVDWLVPENELYDVRDLPQRLSMLPFSHLWLDLFCIPQDGSPAADDEIARQTAIFKGATACIAWMHDVDTWQGMTTAFEWLCKQYLSITEDSNHPEKKFEMWHGKDSTLSSQTVGLMHQQSRVVDAHSLSQNNSQMTEHWEPSTWFSSLWTLQEAVLCPRLELWSKKWHRLEDKTRTAVSLVSLTAFLHLAIRGIHGTEAIFDLNTDPMNPLHKLGSDNSCASNERAGYNSIPSEVRQLEEFLEMTRLNNVLLSSSPTSIIFNANVRRCTGSRAPAIMSAIGVTDWYFERLRDGDHEAQNQCEEALIFGTYPLDFVREAFRKTGARFFETSFTIPKLRCQSCLREKRPIGSMLPFASPKGWLYRNFGPPEVGRVDITENPAANEWVICQDATVRMRSAGIFGSTIATGSAKTEGSLLWFEEDTGVEDGATDDFHCKMKELATGRNVYAIELYQDGFARHGVLLCQRQEANCNVSPLYLIKVGMFWALMDSVTTPWSPTSSVDWIVL